MRAFALAVPDMKLCAAAFAISSLTNGVAGDLSTFEIGTAPSHFVHERFVSFTMDVYRTRWGGWNGCDLSDATNIALAKAMGPCFLRIGGTEGDNTTYDMSTPAADPSYVPSSRGSDSSSASDIPHGTMTAKQWDDVNTFASAAGWNVVFGLNIFDGWEQGTRTWDPTRTLELMQYTKDKGYNVVGWELGNEPNLASKDLEAAEVGNSFATLFDKISEIYDSTGGGTKESPWLVGPDVTKGGVQDGYFANTLTEIGYSPGIDIVTWHHYYVAGSGSPVDASDFTDVSFLDSYAETASQAHDAFDLYRSGRSAATGRSTHLWMGETSGAGGSTSGSEDVMDKFMGIFWFADKLGVAASNGHTVVARQEWMEARGPLDDNGPYPEYWLALVWKRLMGTGVLEVSQSAGASTTRSYAHCASDGSATVVLINVGESDDEVSLNLAQEYPESSRDEYHLTSWPTAGVLESTGLAVNGVQAALTDEGDVPEFAPSVSTASTITLSGRSVAFVVLPEGSIPDCSVDDVLV